jgi:WD40 repeat protein
MTLWDLETGQEVRTLERQHHQCYGVTSVTFSPDGVLALAGGDDGSLTVGRVVTGQLLRTFAGLPTLVSSTALSPDGKLALVGKEDGTLQVWDVTTGRELRTLAGHSGSMYPAVMSVAFSPDAKLALSASEDSTLKLWDVPTGRGLRTLEGHSNRVYSVAFSPDGRRALSGSQDGTVKLWDIGTGNAVWTLAGHSQETVYHEVFRDGSVSATPHTEQEVISVLSVAFSPDGKLALAGEEDGTLQLCELDKGPDVRTLSGHSEAVTAVAFSPDGKLALSGSMDKTVKLWEAKTGRELRTLGGHSNTVTEVAFSQDGKLALSASWDKTVRLSDVATGRVVRVLHLATGFCLFSPDGRHLLTPEIGGLDVCSLASGNLLARMIHFDDGEWVCLSPKGYFNASTFGASYLNVRLGASNAVVSMEGDYLKRFYRPDLVSQILSSGK